jgi:2-polyprenyl-3-methyl-5-hydroxy-6-metoxy-1,4-benzoquinol methylase
MSPAGGHAAERHFESAEAQHTRAYLWEHIISLCAELRARRIVDIGCGNGALCRELASREYEVVGCEPNAESLHFAQLGAPGLVFHGLGVDDDPSVIGNENFDVAIATEVIEIRNCNNWS